MSFAEAFDEEHVLGWSLGKSLRQSLMYLVRDLQRHWHANIGVGRFIEWCDSTTSSNVQLFQEKNPSSTGYAFCAASGNA
jgi:hypothetical protein